MQKEIGQTYLKILEVYGSDGLPSCGVTDAGILGQGVEETYYVGGSEHKIKPGTPRWLLPIDLLHKYTPDKMSKSARNMEKYLARRHK